MLKIILKIKKYILNIFLNKNTLKNNLYHEFFMILLTNSLPA